MPSIDWNTLCYNSACLIAGVFVLDYGADKFIDHTALLARRLGISQTLIALLTAGAEYEEVCLNDIHGNYILISSSSPW
jgi:hypothetical protein